MYIHIGLWSKKYWPKIFDDYENIESDASFEGCTDSEVSLADNSEEELEEDNTQLSLISTSDENSCSGEDKISIHDSDEENVMEGIENESDKLDSQLEEIIKTLKSNLSKISLKKLSKYI